MTWRAAASGAALAALLLAGGCVQTRYVDYRQGEDDSPFVRTVAYEVAPEMHAEPVPCVAVLPFESADPAGQVIEDALARHFSAKVGRVVGRDERAAAVRRLAVALETEAGRRAFARGTRCGHFVRARPWGTGSTYALVWSEQAVGLDVQVERAQDGAVLWRARHRAERSDGGLPFSPFAVVAQAFAATRFKSDRDVLPSVADDAARRLVATFPDRRAVAWR